MKKKNYINIEEARNDSNIDWANSSSTQNLNERSLNVNETLKKPKTNVSTSNRRKQKKHNISKSKRFDLSIVNEYNTRSKPNRETTKPDKVHLGTIEEDQAKRIIFPMNEKHNQSDIIKEVKNPTNNKRKRNKKKSKNLPHNVSDLKEQLPLVDHYNISSDSSHSFFPNSSVKQCTNVSSLVGDNEVFELKFGIRKSFVIIPKIGINSSQSIDFDGKSGPSSLKLSDESLESPIRDIKKPCIGLDFNHLSLGDMSGVNDSKNISLATDDHNRLSQINQSNNKSITPLNSLTLNTTIDKCKQFNLSTSIWGIDDISKNGPFDDLVNDKENISHEFSSELSMIVSNNTSDIKDFNEKLIQSDQIDEIEVQSKQGSIQQNNNQSIIINDDNVSLKSSGSGHIHYNNAIKTRQALELDKCIELTEDQSLILLGTSAVEPLDDNLKVSSNKSITQYGLGHSSIAKADCSQLILKSFSVSDNDEGECDIKDDHQLGALLTHENINDNASNLSKIIKQANKRRTYKVEKPTIIDWSFNESISIQRDKYNDDLPASFNKEFTKGSNVGSFVTMGQENDNKSQNINSKIDNFSLSFKSRTSPLLYKNNKSSNIPCSLIKSSKQRRGTYVIESDKAFDSNFDSIGNNVEVLEQSKKEDDFETNIQSNQSLQQILTDRAEEEMVSEKNMNLSFSSSFKTRPSVSRITKIPTPIIDKTKEQRRTTFVIKRNQTFNDSTSKLELINSKASNENILDDSNRNIGFTESSINESISISKCDLNQINNNHESPQISNNMSKYSNIDSASPSIDIKQSHFETSANNIICIDPIKSRMTYVIDQSIDLPSLYNQSNIDNNESKHISTHRNTLLDQEISEKSIQRNEFDEENIICNISTDKIVSDNLINQSDFHNKSQSSLSFNNLSIHLNRVDKEYSVLDSSIHQIFGNEIILEKDKFENANCNSPAQQSVSIDQSFDNNYNQTKYNNSILFHDSDIRVDKSSQKPISVSLSTQSQAHIIDDVNQLTSIHSDIDGNNRSLHIDHLVNDKSICYPQTSSIEQISFNESTKHTPIPNKAIIIDCDETPDYLKSRERISDITNNECLSMIMSSLQCQSQIEASNMGRVLNESTKYTPIPNKAFIIDCDETPDYLKNRERISDITNNECLSMIMPSLQCQSQTIESMNLPSSCISVLEDNNMVKPLNESISLFNKCSTKSINTPITDMNNIIDFDETPDYLKSTHINTTISDNWISDNNSTDLKIVLNSFNISESSIIDLTRISSIDMDSLTNVTEIDSRKPYGGQLIESLSESHTTKRSKKRKNESKSRQTPNVSSEISTDNQSRYNLRNKSHNQNSSSSITINKDSSITDVISKEITDIRELPSHSHAQKEVKSISNNKNNAIRNIGINKNQFSILDLTKRSEMINIDKSINYQEIQISAKNSPKISNTMERICSFNDESKNEEIRTSVENEPEVIKFNQSIDSFVDTCNNIDEESSLTRNNNINNFSEIYGMLPDIIPSFSEHIDYQQINNRNEPLAYSVDLDATFDDNRIEIVASNDNRSISPQLLDIELDKIDERRLVDSINFDDPFDYDKIKNNSIHDQEICSTGIVDRETDQNKQVIEFPNSQNFSFQIVDQLSPSARSRSPSKIINKSMVLSEKIDQKLNESTVPSLNKRKKKVRKSISNNTIKRYTLRSETRKIKDNKMNTFHVDRSNVSDDYHNNHCNSLPDYKLKSLSFNNSQHHVDKLESQCVSVSNVDINQVSNNTSYNDNKTSSDNNVHLVCEESTNTQELAQKLECSLRNQVDSYYSTDINQTPHNHVGQTTSISPFKSNISLSIIPPMEFADKETVNVIPAEQYSSVNNDLKMINRENIDNEISQNLQVISVDCMAQLGGGIRNSSVLAIGKQDNETDCCVDNKPKYVDAGTQTIKTSISKFLPKRISVEAQCDLSRCVSIVDEDRSGYPPLPANCDDDIYLDQSNNQYINNQSDYKTQITTAIEKLSNQISIGIQKSSKKIESICSVDNSDINKNSELKSTKLSTQKSIRSQKSLKKIESICSNDNPDINNSDLKSTRLSKQKSTRSQKSSKKIESICSVDNTVINKNSYFESTRLPSAGIRKPIIGLSAILQGSCKSLKKSVSFKNVPEMLNEDTSSEEDSIVYDDCDDLSEDLSEEVDSSNLNDKFVKIKNQFDVINEEAESEESVIYASRPNSKKYINSLNSSNESISVESVNQPNCIPQDEPSVIHATPHKSKRYIVTLNSSNKSDSVESIHHQNSKSQSNCHDQSSDEDDINPFLLLSPIYGPGKDSSKRNGNNEMEGFTTFIEKNFPEKPKLSFDRLTEPKQTQDGIIRREGKRTIIKPITGPNEKLIYKNGKIACREIAPGPETIKERKAKIVAYEESVPWSSKPVKGKEKEKRLCRYMDLSQYEDSIDGISAVFMNALTNLEETKRVVYSLRDKIDLGVTETDHPVILKKSYSNKVRNIESDSIIQITSKKKVVFAVIVIGVTKLDFHSNQKIVVPKGAKYFIYNPNNQLIHLTVTVTATHKDGAID